MTNILLPYFLFLSSIYSLHFNTIDGVDKSFNDFSGKKILIVNIATNSSRISQLAQLESLYQQYHDSLIIIAYPSNEFGNEPRTNADIKSFCDTIYHVSFILTEKVSLTGEAAAPVYNWLTHIAENGVTGDSVKNDFQKFLIDKDGELIGIFNPSVLPTDSLIRNAITTNY